VKGACKTCSARGGEGGEGPRPRRRHGAARSWRSHGAGTARRGHGVVTAQSRRGHGAAYHRTFQFGHGRVGRVQVPAICCAREAKDLSCLCSFIMHYICPARRHILLATFVMHARDRGGAGCLRIPISEPYSLFPSPCSKARSVVCRLQFAFCRLLLFLSRRSLLGPLCLLTASVR
jgi:hypothetical protein